MGSIRGVLSGKTRVLEPEHLVGRASSAAQRHTERYVSVQHALIRWTGQRWEVKDLGSRNGTFLNDARLKPGADYEFKLGTKIAFGKLVEEQWELIDDSPPKVMAVPLDEGEPLMLDGDLIALPSNEDP
jgi:pSer/pThr/pTyr-binding forkhead associated (FHA) protein